jgi:hypothetical protein
VERVVLNKLLRFLSIHPGNFPLYARGAGALTYSANLLTLRTIICKRLCNRPNEQFAGASLKFRNLRIFKFQKHRARAGSRQRTKNAVAGEIKRLRAGLAAAEQAKAMPECACD